MLSRTAALKLGHALVAAAWADGELSEEELSSLKDLLFHLPGLRPEDWAELERRAAIPVTPQERERISESLRGSLGDQEDREQVMEALDRVLQTDDGFGEPERQALRELRDSLRADGPGFWDGLKSFFSAPLARRSRVAAGALRPQSRQQDLHQAVFREVGARLDDLGAPGELDGVELQRLCLAGGLMAHIAGVDETIDPGERKVMIEALQDGWNLDPKTSSAVVDVMVIQGEGKLDLHRALREFFDLTTEAERISFLDVLFAVAAADGMVSLEEMEEIRLIALGLKLSNVHYIAAKTRIPSDRRAR